MEFRQVLGWLLSFEPPSDNASEIVVELMVDEDVVRDGSRGGMKIGLPSDDGLKPSEPVSESSSSTVGGKWNFDICGR